MNRIIKFRGKRLGNGEWVYGDLLHINGGCLIYYGSQTKCELIEGKSDIAVEMGMDEIAPVDPDTVGQFTGLIDANDKEIYEGDIILEDKDPTMLEIVFVDGIFFASIGNTHGENPYLVCALRVILDRHKTHVIGNIYDNPELLKGGAK